MKGWKGNSHGHSLAARGIKSSIKSRAVPRGLREDSSVLASLHTRWSSINAQYHDDFEKRLMQGAKLDPKEWTILHNAEENETFLIGKPVLLELESFGPDLKPGARVSPDEELRLLFGTERKGVPEGKGLSRDFVSEKDNLVYAIPKIRITRALLYLQDQEAKTLLPSSGAKEFSINIDYLKQAKNQFGAEAYIGQGNPGNVLDNHKDIVGVIRYDVDVLLDVVSPVPLPEKFDQQGKSRNRFKDLQISSDIPSIMTLGVYTTFHKKSTKPSSVTRERVHDTVGGFAWETGTPHKDLFERLGTLSERFSDLTKTKETALDHKVIQEAVSYLGGKQFVDVRGYKDSILAKRESVEKKRVRERKTAQEQRIRIGELVAQ